MRDGGFGVGGSELENLQDQTERIEALSHKVEALRRYL